MGKIEMDGPNVKNSCKCQLRVYVRCTAAATRNVSKKKTRGIMKPLLYFVYYVRLCVPFGACPAPEGWEVGCPWGCVRGRLL
jgi:hypothetical protein